MGLLSRIKKAFTTNVDVKKYTKKKKTTGTHYSRKGKTVTKKSGGTKSSASSASSSGTSYTSRKGKATTAPVRQAVAKAQKTGKRKATEEKQYLKWKKVQPTQKAETAKANPISVKRNRAQLKSAGVPHTTAVGDSGKRESYKSTKDFYEKNPKTQKKAADAVKDEYRYGNRVYRGAADRVLENLGMESKAKQADDRLGTKINESKEVKKAKASKEYEAGQFVGDAVAFAVPGAAEETVAKGLLKGGAKAAKAAVKVGTRGAKVSSKTVGKTAEKSVLKAVKKGAEKAVKSKTVSSVEKTVAKALVKNDKAKKFAAERAADALVSSPMNLAAASADSKDGKETLKNFAANVGMDVAMGSAVTALKAGKSKVSSKPPETAKQTAKRGKLKAKEAETVDVAERLKSLESQNAEKTASLKEHKPSTKKTTDMPLIANNRKLKEPIRNQKAGPDRLVAKAAIKESEKTGGNVKKASSDRMSDAQFDEYIKSHGVSDAESAAYEGKTNPYAEEFTNKASGKKVSSDEAEFRNTVSSAEAEYRSAIRKFNSEPSSESMAELRSKRKELAKSGYSEKKISGIFADESGLKATSEIPPAEKKFKSTTVKGIVTDVKNGKPLAYVDFKKTDKTSAKEKLSDVSMKAREAFVDDRAALNKVADTTGNEKLSDSINATRTSKSRAAYAINEEIRSFDGTKVKAKSVKEMQKIFDGFPPEMQKDFTTYMNHSNNVARANAGYDMFGGRFTATESLKIHDDIAKKYKGNKVFFELAEDMWKASRVMLDWYVDSGMLSKEKAEMLAKNNPWHLMAARDLSAKVEDIGGDETVEMKGVALAKGSKKPLLSLQQQLTAEIERTARKSDLNKMLNDLSEGRPIHYDKNDPEIINRNEDPEKTFKVEYTKDGDARVYFFKNGKHCWITVDKHVGGEIEKLIRGDASLKTLDLIVTPFRKANQLIRLLSTTFSPTFPLRNAPRDWWLSNINSTDFKAFNKNLPKAYVSIATNDDWFKLFKAKGTMMSSFIYREKSLSSDAMLSMGEVWAKYMKEGKIDKALLRTALKVIKKPLEAIEWFNSMLENSARMAEFIAVGEKIMKEKGYESIDDFTVDDLNKMSHAASKVTVNFARSGYVGKWLNANLVPFFNAGVQGASREIRLFTNAVKTKEAKTIIPLIAKCAAFGLAPALINEIWIACSSDKVKREYSEIVENKKLQNYCVRINGTWVALPAGRLNAIIGMAGRLAVNSKDFSFSEAMKTAWSLSSPADVFTDTVVHPIIRTARNKTWYGGNINSESEMRQIKDREIRTRDVSDESTSSYAKLFAQSYVAEHMLGWTPKQIDNVIDQYGSSWAKMLRSATDQKHKSSSALLETLTEPISQLKDTFTVDVTSKNNLQTGFYDRLDKLKEERLKFKNSKTKAGQAKYESYQTKIDEMNAYVSRMYRINDAIIEIQKNKNFSKDDAERVKALYRYRNQICRDGINGKSLKTGYEATDIQMIREKVGNDKAVCGILFDMDDDYETKPEKILKSGYKNYKKLLDVHEDSCSFPDSNKTYALALAKNNADKKLVYAYGVSQDEIKEAKKAVKAGVTYDGLARYYTSLEKTRKRMGIEGEYTPTYVQYVALKNSGATKALTSYMSAGTVNSRDYHQRKLNAAYAAKEYGLTDKELSDARTESNTGRKRNPKDYLTSADEASAYVEKHYKNKSSAFKAAVWESICNAYFDNGKNPYGEVPEAKVKSERKKYPANTKIETSSDMPTKFGSGQYQKKQRNSLANKAFLRDKLAVVNKAKAVAEGKGDIDDFVMELKKQSGTNGVTRQTRSYFEKRKTSDVQSASSGGGSGRSYSGSYGGRSGRRSGGSSGGGSGGSSKKTSAETKFDWTKTKSAGSVPRGKATKDYGMTDAEILALHKKLQKAYGEKTANAYISALTTRIL